MALPFKWFRIPFASAGTVAAIPDTVQGDGSVSYPQGYGPNYALDPATQPAALNVERDKNNQLHLDITTAMQYFQAGNPAPWISAADNNSVSYPYAKNAVVLYTDGIVYQSLVAANTATPGTDPTKWGFNQRIRLSANTTYFVSTTGTDDPLHGTGTGAAAFRTITYAVAFLQQALDLNGYQLTIAVATGAYNNQVTINGRFFGQVSPVLLSGTAVTVTVGSGVDCISPINGAWVTVSGFTLATVAGGSSSCLSVQNAAVCNVGANMVFGQGGNNGQIYADGAKVFLTASYTINAGSAIHFFTNAGGSIAPSQAITITLTGTPNFTNAFAVASLCGTMAPFTLLSFANTATGVRYVVQLNGVISTGGGGANFLPGNSAGTSLSGGQYG